MSRYAVQKPIRLDVCLDGFAAEPKEIMIIVVCELGLGSSQVVETASPGCATATRPIYLDQECKNLRQSRCAIRGLRPRPDHGSGSSMPSAAVAGVMSKFDGLPDKFETAARARADPA